MTSPSSLPVPIVSGLWLARWQVGVALLVPVLAFLDPGGGSVEEA